MVQTLIKILFILIISSSVYGQKSDKPTCELQQLAIDAALGDSVAQHDLGVEFYSGKNIPQDYNKAATMWRLSGNQGNAQALNNLGYLTYYGKGIKQDYAEGVRLWRLAAEKGFAESQAHIGCAYLKGNFLNQDFIEAYAWALTSKHFVRQLNDKILAEDIAKMTDDLLFKARKNISDVQTVEAEKKAAAYIAKFGVK
jgi:TPR repeat protein